MSSSNPPMPLIPVEILNNSLGAGLLGVVLSAMVYGITCVQTFNYYSSYPKDHVYVKILVAALWVLDTIHMSFVTIMIYHYTVTHWGDYVAFAKTTWSLELNIVIGNVLTSVVQWFYAYRIYRLSRGNYILPCIIAVWSLIQLGLGITFMAHGFQVQLFDLTGTDHATVQGGVAIAADFLCDLFISVTMFILLRRSRTGWSESTRIINTLIIYTINTCAFLTVCTVACLITFLVFPSTLIYAIFYFVLCRLYTNATLSTLNSRTSIRKTTETTSTNGGNVINLSAMHTRVAASGNSKIQTVDVDKAASSVHIHQSVWSDADHKSTKTSYA
ncbi:hypothetical protein PILCRDRAFT_819331 [Piloderma croceum F 1598]|uniref:DUF6534 domain-containing protein n=1 Tax=Piloderma croceum (strain F 1598) TaxID=765440 RepID=A0A0C3C2D3_PILCF|nr:hypothetical protein PILCRDRAFT_819331 [Piloderma croceum F 1598]